MISPRSKPSPAGIASALTLLALCAAAPPEGSPPEGAPQLAFEPASYDFGLPQVNSGGGQATIQLLNSGEVCGAGQFTGYRRLWLLRVLDRQRRDQLLPQEPEAERILLDSGGLQSLQHDLLHRAAPDCLRGGEAIIGSAVEPTNFGAVAVGSAGVVIAVIAGGADGSFHLLNESCTGVLLSPAASCTLLVSFQPLSTGVKTARLGLFGDQDGGAQITLTGVGVEPAPVSAPGAETPSAGAAAPPSRPCGRLSLR